MAYKTFQRGTGAFKCEVCGRMTRTTTQPRDHKICAEDWDLAGLQNMVWDACADAGTIIERDRLFADIIAKGGDGEAVKDENRDLFAFTV